MADGVNSLPAQNECVFSGLNWQDAQSQFVSGKLIVSHLMLANVPGKDRTFDVMGDGAVNLVQCVGTEVCVKSVAGRRVIGPSVGNIAAIHVAGSVGPHNLDSHVPARVIHDVADRMIAQDDVLDGFAVMSDGAGDQPPGSDKLTRYGNCRRLTIDRLDRDKDERQDRLPKAHTVSFEAG